MHAFAASAFPDHARATGVAWMHSASKLGTILAGLLGGPMIGAGWVVRAIFLSFAVPLVIATGASPSWPTGPGPRPDCEKGTDIE